MARLVEGADSSEDNPVEIGEIFTGFANYGLDPDEEFAAGFVREVMRHDRRPSMAQMQRAVGAGGETGDDAHAPLLTMTVE